MIKFGTSGFRGIMNDDFTKENIRKVAIGLKAKAKEENLKDVSVVIGYDNRFMSENFAKWIGAELATDFQVDLFDCSVPSALVSYYAKYYTFGVVITASHNPYIYNGVKIFFDGGKDSDDSFNRILEKHANVDISGVAENSYERMVKEGKITLLSDKSKYLDMLESLVEKKNISENTKILFNVMHGNATKTLIDTCERIGLKNYEIMNESIDPYFEFIPPAPYLKNLIKMSERVKNEKFDIGFAFDGDSDRITLVDKDGEIYDCNTVLGVLYYHLIHNKKEKGAMVKNSAMSNFNIKVAEYLNEECIEVGVGFKSISPHIKSGRAIIGGESNGICYREGALTKDGIMTAFLLLDMLNYEKKSYAHIVKDLTEKVKFPSVVIEQAYNLYEGDRERATKIVYDEKKVFETDKKIEGITYHDGAKFNFENGYWATIRFSGSENVIRFFAEMPTLEDCEKVLLSIEKLLDIHEKQI